MAEKIEYKLKHIGINCADAKEAYDLNATLCKTFNLTPGADRATNIFAGTIFEVMKNTKRGKCGHIALQVKDVEAAMKDLAAKGYSFQEDSILRDEQGKIRFVYLQQQLGGFAIHLTI